jgi:hypothetical protein
MIKDPDMIPDGGQKSNIRWMCTIQSNQVSNQIQRLHGRTSSFDRNMEGQRSKYQSVNFFQDILLIFINYFVSFPELIKLIFHFFLHLHDDHKSAFVYSCFKYAYPYSCIVDLEQDPIDDHIQSDEPQEIKDDISLFVYSLIPSKILDRYRPLKFPSVLHDFPAKHYKYLPMFDGEPDTLMDEKHVQDSEHFSDLFEIEHDDVCMRAFS